MASCRWVRSWIWIARPIAHCRLEPCGKHKENHHEHHRESIRLHRPRRTCQPRATRHVPDGGCGPRHGRAVGLRAGARAGRRRGDQWTLRENRRAFGDYVFIPHRMQGIVRGKIDTFVTLLGEKLPHPVIVTPFGSHGLHHPAGEVATAEGAARSGALLTVSSASTRSMEDIAKASSGPKWFQMYLTVDAGQSKEVLLRARDAGFKAIVFTVDAIGQGSSDEYMRFGNPRPWLPYGNFPTGNPNAFKTDLTWDDLEFIGVAIGRPLMYGLTVGGAGGVMEFMNRELVNTVLHSGVDSIGKLNESHVKRTAA
ncbi:alpha-hydroxy-acid oxidizing protein [Alcaligenaceae bacterium]|nr:alpha-hydroxy-acid oxidizing protein [Alcaligenaceae bacterium]